MNWSHVHLIFLRELRDQLRDRRTMFTIAIIPLLLYPLMGMLMLQMTQFNREHAVRIAIVGNDNWVAEVPLVEGGKIASEFLRQGERDLIQLELRPYPESVNSEKPNIIEQTQETAKSWLHNGSVDLVVVVPPKFAEALRWQTSGRMNSNAEAIKDSASALAAGRLRLIGNQANDQSQIALRRMQQVLENWRRSWVGQQLAEVSIDRRLIEPLNIVQVDVSPAATRYALLWSKLLPFVMLVWALTGAFYPAVDICAGEKERGTLETLLSSPAQRREIVWGKLLTVMTFSVCTALLNLISMQFTASFVMRQFARLGSAGMAEAFGPLPISALGWLFLMLLPMSALFSALALAVAALARSSKEGQYYLMPLLLIGLPLVMLPMLPGVSLSLGTSVVPVTGAVLLARACMEGQYHEAITHLPYVVTVTLICCLLSVRWAVRQFESESVMFRETERYSLNAWIRHVWRDRGQTASPSEALLCGLIILVALFFGRLMATDMSFEWTTIARSTLIIQIGLILAPVLLMATMLTRSLRESLRINIPRPSDLILSILLAFCLHPAYVLLASAIQQEFSVGADTKAILMQLDGVIASAPFLSVIIVLAVLPALCEELAFRGFIFGGLIKQDGIVRAILASSLFFGLSHGVLQQSIGATLMGLVLGIIAWRTGGVVCGMAFHIAHNSLTMTVARAGRNGEEFPAWCRWAFENVDGAWAYSSTWTTISIALSVIGFAWLLLRPANQARDDSLEMKSNSVQPIGQHGASLS